MDDKNSNSNSNSIYENFYVMKRNVKASSWLERPNSLYVCALR